MKNPYPEIEKDGLHPHITESMIRALKTISYTLYGNEKHWNNILNNWGFVNKVNINEN